MSRSKAHWPRAIGNNHSIQGLKVPCEVCQIAIFYCSSSPETGRKRPLSRPSDISRLSRNVSKDDDKTDEDESTHSEASVDQKSRVRKTRRARANSTSRSSNENRKYAPEKYSDNVQPRNSVNKRPASASTVSSSATRPRANTSGSMSLSGTPRKRPESASGSLKSPKGPHGAAATIQKNFRGHSAKEKDGQRVNQLKVSCGVNVN